MWRCSSPTLPQIPDIIDATNSTTCSLPSAAAHRPSARTPPTSASYGRQACKRFFERQQQQQQQLRHQADDCSVRIVDPGAKPKSYGGTVAGALETPRKGTKRSYRDAATKAADLYRQRKFSGVRIHRTSSLNRPDELLDGALGRRLRHNAPTAPAASTRAPLPPSPPAPHRKGDEGDNVSSASSQSSVAISDVIGSFGLFQLLVLVFSGLREGLVGYDALIMSVILQPEDKFLCADNAPLPLAISPGDQFEQLRQSAISQGFKNLSLAADVHWNESAQCFRSDDGGRSQLTNSLTGEPVRCERWLFANETASLGPSLVAEWSLVCHHHWLVAFIESAYFFGLVAGNLTWGYYADKLGRRPAYLAAHVISLVFGALAVAAPSVCLFTVCRFFAAFGSIGYNIIYSIQVELIGLKHRSFSTTLNHLGWGLGVVCIPIVDHLFDDYRPIIGLAPLLSLLMFPWAFWLPESPRWLMAHGHFERARHELERAAKFNGRQISGQLEKDLWALEQKVRADKLAAKALDTSPGGLQKGAYRLIFTTPTLLRDTLILSYLAFMGHLYYYVQTINFAYMKNLSTEANFITSGAGEWASVLIGAILLKLFTRKTCMSLFLLIMAASFAFQSLIDSQWLPTLDTVLIITTNNGFGTLASLLLVFVVLIVNQEVYPTIVRQTGTSITNTLGESGSTLAPLLIQLSRALGPAKANAIYAIFCLLGIVVAQLVTRTDDLELLDT